MKLEKVNNRLYHQVDDEREKPFKWWKQFEWLRMSLTDISATKGIELEYKGVGAGEENRLDDTRVINAKGKFENQLVCLIDPEEDEPARFDEADIDIRPTTKWDENAEGPTAQERVFDKLDDDDLADDALHHFMENAPANKFATKTGWLIHEAGDALNYGHPREPHLTLELHIPEQKFDQVWQRLMTSKDIGRAYLHVNVEVFQSEVERALAEPYHHQKYYIERESLNWAFPVAFGVVTNPVVSDTKAEDFDEQDDDDDEFSPSGPGDHPGKSDTALTATLVAVLATLKSLRTALYIIVVLLLAVIVAVLL